MIKLTIDGRPVEVQPGTTILEACESLGIDVPTLCHLKHLQAEGSCRMCVVEVEGARTLQVSCATPCGEGMKVSTRSEKVMSFRRLVLELMLANHETNCFSCPATGRCKLYHCAMEYGVEESRFAHFKQRRPRDESNEFFNYDPSKCILCRRCVRVCNNLQVNHTLSLKNRGPDTWVGPPFDKLWIDSNCVSCGNCVSVCPTGALTAKAAKSFRVWEVTKTRTTCPYCGVGCQMDLLVKDGRVVGVEPAEGGANPGILCVKGKWAYRFIGHPDRLTTPLIRKDGELQPASWEEALDFVTEGIKKIKEESGPDSIAGFSSARVTNEENYLFMKMMRAVVGTNNVDHCARL
jgi:NADH-quinone oxidoreductase subunit G